MKFEDVVAGLMRDSELHARFINSVSLLEYMGARKILKSQEEAEVSLQVLGHAAEEIRHAQVFKKIALKMSEGRLDSYSDEHLVCGDQAREYMQSLDRGVEAEVGGGNAWENYLLTTLLIEERANQVYPLYNTILAELGFPAALSGIIREENAHLEEMRSELAARSGVGPEKLARLRALEERLFSSWMEALHRMSKVCSEQPAISPDFVRLSVS